MATNLYETLSIPRNASTEDIRRAYRRKALETHPDRLPQGSSAAEKSASEDMFRQVNNAYEVLSDAQKRATYDQHGVWPPPPTAPPRPFANGPHNPFPDPFFQDPFFGPRMDPFGFGGFDPRFGSPMFTDPFVLFNSIFGDIHRAFGSDPFFDGSFERRGFGSSPFDGGFSSRFPPMLRPMFQMPIDLNENGMGGMGNPTVRVQSLRGANNNGRWVSESWSSNTVNGVTHAKVVRKDSEGNEHVTYRLPDGTERYTINGIEQPSSQPQRAIPSNGTSAPPPPYPEVVVQTPHQSRYSRHHGHHHDHYGETREHGGRHRDEHSRSMYGEPPENGSWKFWKS